MQFTGEENLVAKWLTSYMTSQHLKYVITPVMREIF